MILLDTNHLTVIRYPEDKRHEILVEKMRASSDQGFAVPVVALEEQLRGWLAAIHKAREARQQINAYDHLASLIEFFAEWEIVRFDEAASAIFERLRAKKIRVGTMDLRIGAITMANDAKLLTANLQDFKRIPGFRVENWME